MTKMNGRFPDTSERHELGTSYWCSQRKSVQHWKCHRGDDDSVVLSMCAPKVMSPAEYILAATQWNSDQNSIAQAHESDIAERKHR